jgi:hypothetical protein
MSGGSYDYKYGQIVTMLKMGLVHAVGYRSDK